MQPNPVPGPLTWCPSCGWQVGEAAYIEVLEYSYDSWTPLDDVETTTITRLPCDCEPDDYDPDDYDITPGEVIKAGWQCSHCHQIHGSSYAEAEECCGSIVIVPAGAQVTFSNGRQFEAKKRQRVFVKETPNYTITETMTGKVLENV